MVDVKLRIRRGWTALPDAAGEEERVRFVAERKRLFYELVHTHKLRVQDSSEIDNPNPPNETAEVQLILDVVRESPTVVPAILSAVAGTVSAIVAALSFWLKLKEKPVEWVEVECEGPDGKLTTVRMTIGDEAEQRRMIEVLLGC